MLSDKLDKIVSLVFAIAILATAGVYIEGRLSKTPVVITSDEEDKRIMVKVSGAIERAGVYSVSSGSRVSDVIYSAGGVTDNADMELVDVDAKLIADTEINIPSKNSKSVPKVLPVVNINTASATELMLVPDIGETMAARIIDYRKNNGDFESIEDIKNVRGIGDKTFEEIKDYICTQ